MFVAEYLDQNGCSRNARLNVNLYHIANASKRVARCPQPVERRAPMATQPVPAPVRSYRIYFRDSLDALSPPHEFDLASDEEAHRLAMSLLEERPASTCAEVWDRARLVCIVRPSQRPGP